MPLGIGFEQAAGAIDGDVLADAGDHVHQRAARWRVIEHIIGGDERNPVALGETGEIVKPPRILAAIEHLRGEIGAPGRGALQAGECIGEVFVEVCGRQRNQHLPFGGFDQVGEIEMAFTFRRAPASERDQLDQTPIGGAISRITEGAGHGAKIQSRADDKADAGLLGGVMGAHDAGEAVAVGNGESRIAQRMF